MKKQTRTLLILLAAVVVLVGAYAGIRLGLKAKAKREAEEAAQAVVHVGELEDLQEVTYQNPYGVFRFTRQDDGQWVYAEDPELPIDPQNLEDIAEAVAFLASPASRNIGGVRLLVDGGCSVQHMPPDADC